MLPTPAVSQIFSWPSFSRENFSDLTTRLSRAAPGYFRDFVPAAIALGSFYLTSQGVGVSLSILVGAFALNRFGDLAISNLCSEIFEGKIQEADLPQRVHDASARKVRFSMISSALIAGVAAGFAVGSLDMGILCFHAAVKVRNIYYLLYGIEEIALGLAYGAYYAKDYFSSALFVRRAAGTLEETLQRQAKIDSPRLYLISTISKLDRLYTPTKDQVRQVNELCHLHWKRSKNLISEDESRQLEELNQLYLLDSYNLQLVEGLREEIVGNWYLNLNSMNQNSLYQGVRLKRLNQLYQQDSSQLSKEQCLERFTLNQLLYLKAIYGTEDAVKKITKQWSEIFSAHQYDLDALLATFEHHPDLSLIYAQFKYREPNLSDLQISQMASYFPKILTMNYLAENLPEHRFRAIFMPQLFTKEILDEIKRDLQERVDAFIKSSRPAEDRKQLERIASAYMYELATFLSRLEKISKERLSVQFLQDEIDRVSPLKSQAQKVFELSDNISDVANGLDKDYDSFKNPNKTWEVLAYKYLFDQNDIALLAKRLGLGKGKGWDELNPYLAIKGLPDKSALIRHRIIPEKDEDQRAEDKENVMQRLVAFCGPSKLSSTFLQFECPEVLKKIALVSFTILKVGLFGLQVYFYPRETLLGGMSAFTVTLIILAFHPNPNSSWLFPKFSEPTDDIYGLATRVCRELFSCSFLRGGSMGGFLVGANIGYNQARRYYNL